MDTGNFWIAFGLTVFAGLSTAIGSVLAFFTKRTNTKFLAVALGFSAGVMIYVSFVEIIPKSIESLTEIMGAAKGNWVATAAFFGGIFLIALIDKLIPSFENPHEAHKVEELNPEEIDQEALKQKNGSLMRMGVFTALAITIHNFPEGLATFMAAMKDPALGVAIAVAIAIHNIPEGIAVSIPIFYATGDRKKAFMYSFLSGLAEPLGALVGYFLLLPFLNETMFGIIFAGVAGIMVFISLDELLPSARTYGEQHLSIYGLIAGMMVMALSLLLFL